MKPESKVIQLIAQKLSAARETTKYLALCEDGSIWVLKLPDPGEEARWGKLTDAHVQTKEK